MWIDKYKDNMEASYRLEAFIEYMTIDRYTRSSKFSYKNPPAEQDIVCNSVSSCEDILTRYRKVGIHLDELFEEDTPEYCTCERIILIDGATCVHCNGIIIKPINKE